MLGSRIKILIALVIVIAVITVAYYLLARLSGNGRSTSSTVSTLPLTTTIAGINYTSTNTISADIITALLSHSSISVEYSLRSNRPVIGQPNNRSISQEIATYNISGNEQSENLLSQIPANHELDIMQFLINGTDYICPSTINNGTQTIPKCIKGGITYPDFLDMNNYTYVTNANGMILNLSSQLAFSSRVAKTNVSYNGIPAAYFHANVSSLYVKGLRGNLTIYTSTEYGVPLLSRLIIFDPAYNAFNDTVLIEMKLVSVSGNTLGSATVPQYLANVINNGTAS